VFIADCTEPGTNSQVRRKLNQTVILSAVLTVVLAILTSGCTSDSNAPTVVVFPTKIPAGTPLPTFISFETPQASTAGASVSPVSTAIAPTVRATVTFRFINPTAPPAQTSAPPTNAPPTAIPMLDENWNSLSAGVQWRRLTYRASDNHDVGTVVVRIDPTMATFKVIADPANARLIQNWPLALPGAIVIVNASYFDTSFNPIGLIAIDGNVMGRSIPRNDTGMFQVQNNAVKVRSLFLEPYNNTERFDQAAQGFPVLMVRGQVAPSFNPDVATLSARRTVIAQDKKGRILFIVTPFATTTLSDLAKWLGNSGLDIDTAVNMDGGSSTCLYLATGGPSAYTVNIQPVPVVVAVYSR
jgi:Phosphodiester glycosidase